MQISEVTKVTQLVLTLDEVDIEKLKAGEVVCWEADGVRLRKPRWEVLEELRRQAEKENRVFYRGVLICKFDGLDNYDAAVGPSHELASAKCGGKLSDVVNWIDNQFDGKKR